MKSFYNYSEMEDVRRLYNEAGKYLDNNTEKFNEAQNKAQALSENYIANEKQPTETKLNAWIKYCDLDFYFLSFFEYENIIMTICAFEVKREFTPEDIFPNKYDEEKFSLKSYSSDMKIPRTRFNKKEHRVGSMAILYDDFLIENFVYVDNYFRERNRIPDVLKDKKIGYIKDIAHFLDNETSIQIMEIFPSDHSEHLWIDKEFSLKRGKNNLKLDYGHSHIIITDFDKINLYYDALQKHPDHADEINREALDFDEIIISYLVPIEHKNRNFHFFTKSYLDMTTEEEAAESTNSTMWLFGSSREDTPRGYFERTDNIKCKKSEKENPPDVMELNLLHVYDHKQASDIPIFTFDKAKIENENKPIR